MNRQSVSRLFALVLAVGFVGELANAAPYYYYFADESTANQQAAADAQAQAGAQEVSGQTQQAAKDAGQQVQDKSTVPNGGSGETPMRERISGHMSDLYSHGSSAVKSMVDTVQPDIKNIGKDLTEVYQQTRDSMGKRIEPIAHTVRPYIDQAQKAVAPYVSKAREEVPKAMSKVWSKIGGQHQDGQQTTGEQIQQTATNMVQDAENAAQKAPDAAKQQ